MKPAFAGAVLAATILALAACREEGARPLTVVAAADTADQVIVGFEHFVTSNGVRKATIKADSAYIYTDTQTTDLRAVTATFFGQDGREVAALDARQMLYRFQDNSMEALGNVVVQSTDGRRLATERLVYDPATDKVTSDRAFTYDAGGQHLVGEGFTTDPSFRNVVTQQPRGTPGSELLLPGQ